MPRKNTYRRKRTYRRKPTRMQNYSAGLGQLKSDVMRLKGLINVEFKCVDTVLSSTVNSSGTLQLLNGLAQGDTATTREGATVRFKSLQLKGFMAIAGAATATACRRLVFIDKQPNQAAPVVGDILDNTTAALVNSFRNLSHRKRFVILRDDHFTMSEGGPEALWYPDVYMSLDMITTYNGNAGTIADIETNAIWAMYISSEATAAPSIAHNVRIRYIDN